VTASLFALLCVIWGMIFGWSLTVVVQRFVNPTVGIHRRD
jgi:hypothetical protein